MGQAMTEPVFQATGLTKIYRRAATQIRAIDGVEMTVNLGQRLGIVGESGSGKSTLIRLLAGLSKPTSGDIKFRGRTIVGRPERDLGDLRAGVQLVFQDPRSSLDPRMRVGRIVTEPLRSPLLRGRSDVPSDAKARLAEVLSQVGLRPADAKRYPHQFSGGQRQRIALARALVSRPDVLIADEAVSALDVSARAVVLNLIVDIAQAEALTLLFVSHDLRVVRHICDSVLVLRAGQIVESGPSEHVFADPQHPYTKQLLACVPKLPQRNP